MRRNGSISPGQLRMLDSLSGGTFFRPNEQELLLVLGILGDNRFLCLVSTDPDFEYAGPCHLEAFSGGIIEEGTVIG